VLPELLEGLQSPLAKSRHMAAEALGSLGPAAKGALAPLERATKDPDADVREAAAKAVGSIRGSSKKQSR
jgi:HEAT repeat protein